MGWIRNWIKWTFAGDELRKLMQYRCAIHTADRWLACDDKAVALCQWIKDHGEVGFPGKEDIGEFRTRYRTLGTEESTA